MDSVFCLLPYKSKFKNECEQIISGSDDMSIRFWNINTGKCLSIILGHKGSVNCLQLLAINEELLISGSNDRTIKIWNLENEKCVKTLKAHQGPVECLLILERKNQLASGSCDKKICLWSLIDFSLLKVLRGHGNIFLVGLK